MVAMHSLTRCLRFACFVLLLERQLVHATDGSGVVTSSRSHNLTSAWETSLANQWHVFSSWTNNSPRGMMCPASSEIVDTKQDGATREMMLIYGRGSNKTWLYDIGANSWEAVQEESGPKGIIYHTLVTLCRTSVLLFGGVSSLRESKDQDCSNETWIFEIENRKWRQIYTTVHFQSKMHYVTPRCRHVSTVVHMHNSSCGCKESMIVYSGFKSSGQTWSLRVDSSLSDLWLLTCKDDSSNIYEWKLLDSSPPKIAFPAIISAFGKTIGYFYGLNFTRFSGKLNAREVWSYQLSNFMWRKHFNSTDKFTDIIHYATRTRAIYFSNSDRSNHYMYLCCSKNSYAVFDLVNEKWLSFKCQLNVLPNLLYRNLVKTKVADYGIILGRPRFRLTNSVWEIKLSDDLLLRTYRMPSSELSPVKPRILSTGGFMAKQQEILNVWWTTIFGQLSKNH